MKLEKLKLNALTVSRLKDKDMNQLSGGFLGCRCSCYWADKGGSSSDDNMNSNYASGDGTQSKEGCNQYWAVGSGILECNSCTA